MGEDAAVTRAAGIRADVHVGLDGGNRSHVRARAHDRAAPAADGSGRIRGMQLSAVEEVLAGAGFAAGAVAVDEASGRARAGTRAGRRAGMAAIEDPAPEPDDAVARTGPRPRGIGAGLPLEVEQQVVIAGRKA